MTAVGNESPLASKCLDLCQTLASQGQAFTFSLTIGSTFSFSLDTRSKEAPRGGTKKKASPSTLKRNARRKEEFLLKKSKPQSDVEEREPDVESNQGDSFPCDQCENTFRKEKGLKIHKGKAHKVLTTPEKMRAPPTVSSLTVSPLKEFVEIRKEVQNGFKCGGCEEVFNSEDNMNTHIENNHSSIRCSGCKVLIWDQEPPPPACPACSVAWIWPPQFNHI